MAKVTVGEVALKASLDGSSVASDAAKVRRDIQSAFSKPIPGLAGVGLPGVGSQGMSTPRQQQLQAAMRTAGVGASIVGGVAGGVAAAGTAAALGKVGQAFGALTGTLTAAARTAIQTAARFEELETAFGVLTGSKRIGAGLFSDIQELAIRSPFKTSELATEGRKLLGAGVAPGDVTGMLSRLGDISAGGGADLGRLTTAYSQVVSKGRLMAEEMLQFTEAGLGYQDIARGAGMSVMALRDSMQAGKVGADVLNRSITNLTSGFGKFAGAMDARSATVSGRWDSIGEGVETLLGRAGQSAFRHFGVADFLGGVSDRIQSVSQKAIDAWVGRMAEGLRPVGELFGLYGKTFADFASKLYDGLPTWKEFGSSLADFFRVTVPLAADGMRTFSVAALEVGKTALSVGQALGEVVATVAEYTPGVKVKDSTGAAAFMARYPNADSYVRANVHRASWASSALHGGAEASTRANYARLRAEHEAALRAPGADIGAMRSDWSKPLIDRMTAWQDRLRAADPAAALTPKPGPAAPPPNAGKAGLLTYALRNARADGGPGEYVQPDRELFMRMTDPMNALDVKKGIDWATKLHPLVGAAFPNSKHWGGDVLAGMFGLFGGGRQDLARRATPTRIPGDPGRPIGPVVEQEAAAARGKFTRFFDDSQSVLSRLFREAADKSRPGWRAVLDGMQKDMTDEAFMTPYQRFGQQADALRLGRLAGQAGADFGLSDKMYGRGLLSSFQGLQEAVKRPERQAAPLLGSNTIAAESALTSAMLRAQDKAVPVQDQIKQVLDEALAEHRQQTKRQEEMLAELKRMAGQGLLPGVGRGGS